MKQQGAGPVANGLRVDRDVAVPMPGGGVLRADVFRARIVRIPSSVASCGSHSLRAVHRDVRALRAG